MSIAASMTVGHDEVNENLINNDRFLKQFKQQEGKGFYDQVADA